MRSAFLPPFGFARYIPGGDRALLGVSPEADICMRTQDPCAAPGYHRSALPDRLYFTDSDEANELIATDPMALLIGFALDQQVPVRRRSTDRSRSASDWARSTPQRWRRPI